MLGTVTVTIDLSHMDSQFMSHFDNMFLKQKQTNFFVLEAAKKITPNKAFFIFFLFWKL